MQLSNYRITKSLRKYLQAKFGATIGYATDEEAVLAVIAMLEIHAGMEPGERIARYIALPAILREISSTLHIPEKAPELEEMIHGIERAVEALDPDLRLSKLEALEAGVLQKLDSFLGALSVARELDPAARHAAALQFVRWDCTRLKEQSAAPVETAAADRTIITQDSLSEYLKDHFQDPDLKVTAFTRAAGGYGKETIFFDSEGKLAGRFVLRRDRAVQLIDNDCHRTAWEYPVVRAVRSTGFPAPDALWLDVEHKLLPGGDFFVMRRAPGQVQGTVFGGSGMLPDTTVTVMAETVARLHNLEPLTQLGDINESIHSALWTLPVDEVVYRYIRGYYDYYMKHRISNMPSLAALFGWLFDNIPECKERPVLLHGDLGLHNLLFDGTHSNIVLDWEQAHIGDPMEDVAYVRNTANTSLNWKLFSERYEKVRGREIDPKRVHYHMVWGQVKNVTGGVLATDGYATGKSDDIRLAHLGFVYNPIFLELAMRLISPS